MSATPDSSKEVYTEESGKVESAEPDSIMRSLVVDASVAVKWFLPEVHSEAAMRVLSLGAPLLIPDLLYAEVGNIVWKRVRMGEITKEEAATLLQTLGDLPLAVLPTWPFALSALEIACATGRTVYDSLYVALAVRENARLVTADERLYNALKDGPLQTYLCWIETL